MGDNLIKKLREENKFYKEKYRDLYNKLKMMINEHAPNFEKNKEKIVKFGNEPIDSVEYEHIERCFHDGIEGDANLFEILHFYNPKYTNVKIKVEKKNYFLAYDSITWSKTTLETIVRKHLSWLAEQYRMYLINKKKDKPITEFDKERYKIVTQYEEQYKLRLSNLILAILTKYKDL